METVAVNGAVEVAETAGRAAESLSGVGGALTMCVIAFTVVFLVLGGLTGVIYGIKYIAQGLERKKNEPPSGGSGVQASVASTSPTPASDSRLLAVITAAVAASGISGRITGIYPNGEICLRHVRSSGWRGMALFEGIQALGRDWK